MGSYNNMVKNLSALSLLTSHIRNNNTKNTKKRKGDHQNKTYEESFKIKGTNEIKKLRHLMSLINDIKFRNI